MGGMPYGQCVTNRCAPGLACIRGIICCPVMPVTTAATTTANPLRWLFIKFYQYNDIT